MAFLSTTKPSNFRFSIAVIILLFISLGCTAPETSAITPTPSPLATIQSATPTSTPQALTTKTAPAPIIPPATPTIRPPRQFLPERVPTTELRNGGFNIPQEILETLTVDLGRRTEGNPEDISVAEGRAVTWSDGSLGCPQPGRIYTQALVEGFQVILSLQGQKYDYRVGNGGTFLLCESAGIPGIGAPGNGNRGAPRQ
ncbi:MAG: hypothetical protein ACE5Q6_06150 [Dehalococcoidia bacterium]